MHASLLKNNRIKADRLFRIEGKAKLRLSSGCSIDGEASEILRRGRGNCFIQKLFNMKQPSQKIRDVQDSE